MILSNFDEHSSPLFKQLKIIKLFDIITSQIAIFMMNFYNLSLPSTFNTLFNSANRVHNCNRRFAEMCFVNIRTLEQLLSNFFHFEQHFQQLFQILEQRF